MSETFSYSINTKSVKELVKNFKEIGNSSYQFFNLLGIKIDQMTQTTFRMLGARSGMPKWRGYSMLTLHPARRKRGEVIGYNLEKWNRRRGTDNSKTRKYSEKSVMLQAGGSFKRSFGIIKADNRGLKYGTSKEYAINYGRPVLFVTGEDKTLIQRMFNTFVRKKIGVMA